MRTQEIIAKKRDGGELNRDEIDCFINGVCDGNWADYQISALLMAIFIRGLSDAESDELTRAMVYSGEILDFSEIERPKADKHSTGGVGDKTSLIIAPLAASCGVAVPMISGRGLGHTGGTLDKLESIPGYNVNISTREFRAIIKECGFAMSGQTAEIAPADKKLYAIRDATATVPYIPLIVASIMSKKLAEGLDALVLDVKTGSGAFMRRREDAVRLADAMVKTGLNFGVKVQAVVSDMDQPLGKYVGNALEVFECIRILRNEVDEQARATYELSLELAARMLVLAGKCSTVDEAAKLAADKIYSGEALEAFARNIELQGGDRSICEHPERLVNKGLLEVPIFAERPGYVAFADASEIGNAVAAIGGGRTKAEDGVDAAVGYRCEKNIGDEVREGEVLGVLLCRTEDQAGYGKEKLKQAYKIDENPVEMPPLIKEVI